MSDGNSHFLMAIGRIDGGLLIETADDCLRDVISAVRRTGKKGTVTVQIEVAANGEMGLSTTGRIVAKAPQVSFGQSFFFTDRNGNLTREAPSMEQLGLMTKDKANG